MKKLLLSFALLIGVASATNAQGLKLGLKGGFNGATFSGTDSKGSEYKAGFAAGGVLNYGFNDMMSVQGELLYSQKGVSQDLSSGGTNKSTIGYLDVPILFKVNTGDDGKGLFFELGPQGSFLIHQRSFTEDSKGNDGASDTSTDRFNKVVVGYVAGLGYQITSGLGLGIRYTGDLSQVYKDESTTIGGTTITAPNVHNSVFQFQVHYLFGGE